MGNKYVVNCLAITDKHGNVHYDEKITFNDDGTATSEPVVLDIDMFDQAQLDRYLKSGHLVPFEAEDDSERVTPVDKKVAELTIRYLKLTGKDKVPGTWGLKKLEEEVKVLEDKDKEAKDKAAAKHEKELKAKKGS